MQKIKLMMIALVIGLMAGCGGAEGDSTEIRFGETAWTSTVPPTEVAALIIEDMGYEVSQTDADAGGVYTGLAGDDLDVYMDGWFPAHAQYLERYEDDIDDTAVSYDEVEAGLVVPDYMEDINSIEDIKGNEDLFGNEILSIEEGSSASETIDAVIEDYELDVTQVNSSEAAMVAEAMGRIENEEPVVFWGWRPHSMFNQFDLKIIEEDRGHISEDDVTVRVITNNKLQEKAPDVYEFLSNWSIPMEDVENMIQQIENEGAEPEAIAREWIENNQDKVDEMLGENNS